MKKHLITLVALIAISLSSVYASAYTILGSTTACKGNIKTYSIQTPEGCPVNWSVTNATIISGQNSNSITVKFNNSGSVTIKAYTCCDILTKNVTVNSAPSMYIRQVPNYNNTELEFVAEISPYSYGTYNWECGSNSIQNQGSKKVTIYMSNPAVIKCTFTNTCGSVTATTLPMFHNNGR
ncbi:MAG: hypothetical protein N4A72_08080 [Bacteroidales bacterium]|jgi:hypothetical protein|nr:hypothetical protein [Bacteroidales bacterium]